MNRLQGFSELLLFFVAATAGIYGFGRAFRGNALWLGVSAVALVLLAMQMARVQDHWPRRKAAGRQTRAPTRKREHQK